MDQNRSKKRAKVYARAYFDHWYRRHGIGGRADVGRSARYVLAAAEHLLLRPVRRVLDVGCLELFTAHGLHRIGPHLYAGAALLPTLTALEGPFPRS